MKTLLKLALPTSAMYCGLMLMGLVDMLFVGKLGAVAIGGLGLGNSVFSWVMTIGIGMIYGVDYPASSAIGSGDRPRAFRVFVQGLHLSWVMAIPATAAVIAIAALLDRFGMNPEVVPLAKRYLVMTSVSLLPIFVFNTASSYLRARSVAVPTLLILLFANVLNAFLDAALIEGRFGLPNLGFDGAAWATTLCRYAMALAIVGYVLWRDFRTNGELSASDRARVRNEGGWAISRPMLAGIVRLGLPASAQMLLEVGVFSLATALAAKFPAIDLAAHQVVLNTASLLFMVPLGVSAATGSLVGQSIGAGDRAGARRTGNSALLLGVLYALSASTLLILFANPALGLYSSDPAVIDVAKRLLFVAALFQLSDGVQVIATGALRGLGNTLSAAIANGVGHWGVGLPVGLYLGFHTGRGVYGIWVGLATGLTAVAASLYWEWARRSRQV